MRLFLKSLFVLSLLFLPLHSEIYEIRLTIEGFECPYCPRAVTNQLKEIPGVDHTRLWVYEGIGIIGWKDNVPFKALDIFKTFFKTQFTLKDIAVDVEGTMNYKRGASILNSQPDGSIFYIDNRGFPGLADIKEGQSVRIKGFVSSQRGYNFITVDHVLPANAPDEEINTSSSN